MSAHIKTERTHIHARAYTHTQAQRDQKLESDGNQQQKRGGGIPRQRAFGCCKKRCFLKTAPPYNMWGLINRLQSIMSPTVHRK